VETPVDAGSQALAEALHSSFAIVKFVMLALVAVFLGSGFFTVGPQEKAIKLRFGRPVGEGDKVPDLIEKAITPKTRAIIIVHLFGKLCDIDTASLDGYLVLAVEDGVRDEDFQNLVQGPGLGGGLDYN
jgi:hypothetical protein